MVADMNSILKRPVIVGAVIGAAGLVAVVLALSLSGGSDPTAGATTTSSPAAAATSGHNGGSGSRSTTGAAQAWHNLAQCFRGHGYPIADPTVNADGTSSWSSSGSAGPSREVGSATRAVGKTTCRAEFDALPTQTVQPPSTQAERHGLVLFARCMRDHGIADFPDPNSEGAFALNARLLALGKHGADKQLRACSHFNLGKGIVLAGGPATTN
jgi:hypothetical protein